MNKFSFAHVLGDNFPPGPSSLSKYPSAICLVTTVPQFTVPTAKEVCGSGVHSEQTTHKSGAKIRSIFATVSPPCRNRNLEMSCSFPEMYR